MHHNSSNVILKGLNATQRVEWALDNLSGEHVLSSSFGAQSAVMLHLLTQIKSDIPIILIDTGYLFKETYDFVDQLTERLQLNLKVYRSETTPAWQESHYGNLWEQGVEGIQKYNQMNKVAPMECALKDLNVKTWFAGLRRSQSESRDKIDFLSQQGGRYKFYPIADWGDRDIHFYLKKHQLPYHPLWYQNYVSIGDTHTTKPLTAEMSVADTRFFGLTRECGLHQII